MSPPSRRLWSPFNKLELWRLLLALLALLFGMLFVLALCWLFLHYQQQQLLAQVLAGAALLFGGLLTGIGVKRWWTRSDATDAD